MISSIEQRGLKESFLNKKISELLFIIISCNLICLILYKKFFLKKGSAFLTRYRSAKMSNWMVAPTIGPVEYSLSILSPFLSLSLSLLLRIKIIFIFLFVYTHVYVCRLLTSYYSLIELSLYFHMFYIYWLYQTHTDNR